MVQSDPADEIGELVLYFIFFTVLLGAVVTYLQSLIPDRFAVFRDMPYVVVIFILGFIIGISVSKGGNGFVGTFSTSMSVWENFPPELLIYMFLPVLIYEEVTNLNLHHFKSTVAQGLVLAFPAAISGTFILGSIINGDGIPFPVDWGTNAVYLFASILCATDSVSVVSLLSKMELFRSQKLRYIIVNESLFNDATALVLYTVFLSGEISNQYESTITASEALLYTIKIIFFSPLIGLGFGFATVFFILLIEDPHNEVFMVLRSLVTVASAYLSFLVANYEVMVSGIISTIFNGLVFMYRLPVFFKHYEEVHSVWHVLSWLSNTLIFHVAGLVYGYRTVGYFTWAGFANIVVIYLYLFIVRAMVLIFFYPLLNWLGKGVTFNEMVFMIFSGLRGAVSVALALNVSLLAENGYMSTMTVTQANEIFLYTGGVSGLSLILNANMAEWVLKQLQLSEKQEVVSYETQLMRNSCKRQLIEASVKDWLEIPFAHRLLIKTKCRFFNEIDEYAQRQGMSGVVPTDTVFSGPDSHIRDQDKYFPVVSVNQEAVSLLEKEDSVSSARESGSIIGVTHSTVGVELSGIRQRAETKEDMSTSSRFGVDISEIQVGADDQSRASRSNTVTRGDRSDTTGSQYLSTSRKNTASEVINTLTQPREPSALPTVTELPGLHGHLDLSKEELKLFIDLVEEQESRDDDVNGGAEADDRSVLHGDDDDFDETRSTLGMAKLSREDRNRAATVVDQGLELSALTGRRSSIAELSQKSHSRRNTVGSGNEAAEADVFSALLNPYMNADDITGIPAVSSKLTSLHIPTSVGAHSNALPTVEEGPESPLSPPPSLGIGEHIGSSDMYISTVSEQTAINEQLLVNVRSTFLECVRAFYLHKVRKRVLQRYSDVFRYLMASVDYGLESVATSELQDWDYIERVVTPHPSLIDFKWVLELERVKPIYQFLKRHIKVIRKWDRKFHEDCMNTLNYFVFAHQYAQTKIPSAFDLAHNLSSPEVEHVVRESQIVVRLAMLKLHSTMHDERMLQYRYTKDKLLGILQVCENVLFDLQSEHIIGTSDLEYFLEMLSEERLAFKKLFRDIRKVFEVSSQRKTRGMIDPVDSFMTST